MRSGITMSFAPISNYDFMEAPGQLTRRLLSPYSHGPWVTSSILPSIDLKAGFRQSCQE